MANTIHFDEENLDSEVERLTDAIAAYSKEYADALRKAQIEEGVPVTFLLENLWKKINDQTRTSFVELVEGSIESIDESELIESKKENT